MKTALRALALVALVAAGACTSDSTGGSSGGTTTTWVGLVQGSDGIESGSLTITAQTASPAMGRPGGGISLAAGDVTATGTYKRVSPTPATTVDLSGTYNPDGNSLDLAGSGYTFTGSFDGESRLEGNFTGPGGDGNFVTEKNTANAQVFCGHYTGGDSGTWSFVVSNGVVHGQAVSDVDGTTTPLDGVVNAQGHITIYFPGTTTPLAEGDITGNTASGTWNNSGPSGDWTGSTSCQ